MKTTKHELLQRLKRLHKEGFALSSHTITKLDGGNFYQILRSKFGTVRRALHEAGVPYTTPEIVWNERKRKCAGIRKIWTWKIAIRMIKELHGRGDPINWWSVRHRGDDYERMAYWASERCSCGYNVLLKKAGFDPDKIRQQHPSRIAKGRDGKVRYSKKYAMKRRTVRAYLEDQRSKSG